jgi:hypothetical protein
MSHFCALGIAVICQHYIIFDVKVNIFNYDCTVNVSDIDKAIKAVKANGDTVRMEKMEIPNVGWFASVTDTEGNMFSIMQSTMDNTNIK